MTGCPELGTVFGDGPVSVRAGTSTTKGASLFLRKRPSATIDRGASVPPSATDQGRACPARRGPSCAK